ncbi:MAG: hypothetical protein C5B60_09785 [Chloroflexi bacterium]|nr:MAG: hypothetical protein C5B60_09785 [Chloroflexota bacterium]
MASRGDDLAAAMETRDIEAGTMRSGLRAPGKRYAFEEAAEQGDYPTTRRMYRMMVPEERRPARQEYRVTVKDPHPPRREERIAPPRSALRRFGRNPRRR